MVPARKQNALTSYDDTLTPYKTDWCFTRPGYRPQWRLDTRLLEACKRSYIKRFQSRLTSKLWLWRMQTAAMGELEQVTADWKRWYQALNSDQRVTVNQVHVVAQGKLS